MNTVHASQNQILISFVSNSKSRCHYQRNFTHNIGLDHIRRFDVVAAMLRAGRYIEDLNRSDLRRISELILNQVLVRNYIVNYMNCLKCLRGKGYSLFSANTYLQSLIGAEYPGLNKVPPIVKTQI